MALKKETSLPNIHMMRVSQWLGEKHLIYINFILCSASGRLNKTISLWW